MRRLERIPCALLALPLRVAAATVFRDSAMVKLDCRAASIALLRDGHRVAVPPGKWATARLDRAHQRSGVRTPEEAGI